MREVRSVFVLVALLACAAACDSGSPTAPGSGPARDITNSWNVQGVQGHSYNLECNSCPASAAAFDGQEFLNGAASDLTGQFDASGIRFTVARSTGEQRYEGRFVNDDTIEVTSGSETLTLIRDTG